LFGEKTIWCTKTTRWDLNHKSQSHKKYITKSFCALVTFG